MQNEKPKFNAVARNQYTCPIGYGVGETAEQALADARAKATFFLSSKAVNPNWRWRIKTVRLYTL